jgi:hypothetical protein
MFERYVWVIGVECVDGIVWGWKGEVERELDFC